MLKLTLLMTSLLTLSTFANSIKDPHGLLYQLDNFSIKRSFQEEFIVGDYIKTESEICMTDEDGNEVCDVTYSDIEVTHSNAKSAQLSSGLIITKSTYEKHNRNAVRFFLSEQGNKILQKTNFQKSNSYYYNLKSLSIDDIDPNWAIATLSFDIVVIDTDGSEFAIPLQLTVEKDAPFVGQVASLSVESMNGNSLTFYTVIEWYKQIITPFGIKTLLK